MSYRPSMPCSCGNFTCLCCAKAKVKAIKLDHQICTNITFNLEPTRVETSLLYNDKVIHQTYFDVGNPGPICCPMPIMPLINFCATFYDVSLKDDTFSTCTDFNVNFFSKSLLRIPFDCLKLNKSGLKLIKNV